MINELDPDQNRQFATSPLATNTVEQLDKRKAASKSTKRVKKNELQPAAITKTEASIEPPAKNIPQLAEPRLKGSLVSPKKNSREIALQQEIREMNKEKSMHILESIKKQEVKAEEKKTNRLEQIMEKVKFQRTQYGGKKSQVSPTENLAEVPNKRKPSKADTGADSIAMMGSSNGTERANSRDETIGGSTNYHGSQFSGAPSGNLGMGIPSKGRGVKVEPENSKKFKPRLEEIQEAPRQLTNLRDKPQGVSKIGYELSLLKDRKLLVSSSEATGKYAKKVDQSFSIDVGQF
jgi:hypothetical protein